MSEANNPGQPLRLDPDAESADPELPAFLARPEGAPVYHGFPVVPEIETDGWLYCAITDYECDSPQTDGDGFVIAPGWLSRRNRLGHRRSRVPGDLPPPPESDRWGVYEVCVPRPVGSVEDLVFNFRAFLPALQKRYQEIRELS